MPLTTSITINKLFDRSNSLWCYIKYIIINKKYKRYEYRRKNVLTAFEDHVNNEPLTNLKNKSANVPVAIDGESEKKQTCSSKVVKLKIK